MSSGHYYNNINIKKQKMQPIIKKIEKYLIHYVAQTQIMNSTALERSSKSLIIECETELLKLMRNREIALKTIKRLKNQLKISK
jgi:hypothetical protein